MRSKAMKAVLIWISCLKATEVGACKNTCFSKCDCEGTTMDCSDSDLEILPDSIPFNTTELVLSNNRIPNYNESALSQLLGNMIFGIRKLHLDRNKISSLSKTTFQNMSYITELNLDFNELNLVYRETLAPIMSTLVNLTLRNNKLTEIPAFSYGYLRYIDVRGNCIISLRRFFSKKSRLNTIKVGGQSVQCGEQPNFSNYRLDQLNYAEEVDFRGTPDTHSLVFENDFFEKIPDTLKYLHIQDATVRSINFTTSSVETIHLQNLAGGLKLTGLATVCRNVKSIFLEDADIQVDETLVENCALKKVYIDNATVIYASYWDKLVNLSELIIHRDLSLTKLTINNTRYNLTGIGPLTYLDLSLNYIEKIEDRFFSQLTRLIELYLESNYLKKLEPESFANATSLQVLDVSQNQIEELGHRSLELPALRFLNLSRNLIEAIPDNFFSGILNLSIVDLTQNRLKDIALFVKLQVKGLVVLSDFNPWDCDNQSIQQYQEIIDQKNVDLVCSYSYNNNQTTKRQLQRQEFIDEFNRDNKLCIICNTPGIVKGLVFEDAMKLLLPPGVTTEKTSNGTSVPMPLPLPVTTYILIGVGAGLFVIIVVTLVIACYCCCNNDKRRNRERRKQLRKLSSTISAKLGLSEYASIKSMKESEYQTIHETGFQLPLGMGDYGTQRTSTIASITSSEFRQDIEMPHIPIPRIEASSTTVDFGYERPILHVGDTESHSSSFYDDGYMIFPEGQTMHKARDTTQVFGEDTFNEAETKKRNDSMTSNLYINTTRRETPKSPARKVYRISSVSKKEVKFEFDDDTIAKVNFTGETSGQK